MRLSQVLERAEIEIIKITIYSRTIIIRAIYKLYYESPSLLEL